MTRRGPGFSEALHLGTNKTFSAPSACLPHVGSTVPDDGDCITLAASSASTAGKISPSGWGPRRRFCCILANSSCKGFASAAHCRAGTRRRRVQVLLHLQRRRLMLMVERDELLQDVVARAGRRMLEDFFAGDHLEADAAEAHRHAHADEPRIVLSLPPGATSLRK